ncbi:hypothetical protein PIB30_031118 [Stylosanthes scabra]|uniref:Uncharacterized protein n=1 Tax=Stylosanthes scabra TaxID=79078 RepID=A0ABU6WBZ6_9FABA|nr:hypothetical protein [Stylosanthes scabra]
MDRLSPSQHLSGVELTSKEDHRAKGHHTPPPISQGLRRNITRSTRRKTGLRGLVPPSQLSLGFAVIYPSSLSSSPYEISLRAESILEWKESIPCGLVQKHWSLEDFELILEWSESTRIP